MSSEFKIIRNGDPVRGAKLGTERSIMNTCVAVTAQAKALAPVDFGRLRNSIMWKTKSDSGGFNRSFDRKRGKKVEKEIDVNPGEFEGYVGSALDYAVYQEFGTRRTSPQPYLRPSVISIRSRQFGERITADHIIEMRKAMGAK